MALALSDFQFWGCAVMPDDEVTTNIGGAIDLTKKIVFTRLGGTSTLEMLSSSGSGDNTQTVTITYMDATGAILTEVKTLNNTSVVAFSSSMKAFLKAVKSATTTGTITIRKASAGATICTLEPAVLQVRILAINAISDSAVQKIYFDRFFVKNIHATLALTQALASIVLDTPGVWTFALDTSLNGTSTNGGGNNRAVAPAGYSFDASPKGVANSGSLTPGNAQGVWMKMLLPVAKAPFDDTFTFRLSGVSA